MGMSKVDKLKVKAQRLQAGVRAKRTTVSASLTGRAAEQWLELEGAGRQAGLRPSDVLALLLEEVGAAASEALKDLQASSQS